MSWTGQEGRAGHLGVLGNSTEFRLPPGPELSLFCSKCLVLENTSLNRSDQSMENWVISQVV